MVTRPRHLMSKILSISEDQRCSRRGGRKRAMQLILDGTTNSNELKKEACTATGPPRRKTTLVGSRSGASGLPETSAERNNSGGCTIKNVFFVQDMEILADRS